MTDIEAIRARAEAATEGPWDHFRSAYLGNLVHRIGSASDVDDVAFVPCSWGHEADADFISNARQDIPDLLAVIARVRELHRPHCDMCRYCASCSLGGLSVAFPCPTVRALDGDS